MAEWDSNKVRTVTVAGLCIYEVVAIASGRIPTITSIAWKTRNSNWGRIFIWNVIGYLSWHLLLEEAVSIMEDAIEEKLENDCV